jgi:long-chain acyl-CoA synthetase
VRTLVSLWDEAECRRPDKVALVDAALAGDTRGAVRLTYRDAGARIRRLSHALASRGQVRRGEVVALLAPNCAEFVVSYFAITRLGAVVQPIDERLAPEEMLAILQAAGARLLIAHAALWPRLEPLRSQLTAIEQVLGIGATGAGVELFEEWIAQADESTPGIEPQPDDVAELMYTSGTTGEPKGVMRTHRNVLAAARNSIRGFGYRGDDVIAIVMPMSHSSALNSQMLPLLELGGTLVLFNRFEPNALIKAIRREGVTCMRAVPAMARLLLGAPDFCARELPSLRLVCNSSAPIDPHTYTEVKHRFESIQVLNSYGLTEASTCTVLPDELALALPDSVGTPIEDVEMKVVDEEGYDVADGAEGEICVRGEHVFAGYRGQPERTRAVLIDGWLHTGDLAHRDARGNYFLHGRRDDVINTAGRKYAPLEVENCILALPGVAEAVVVGEPHPVLGEVAKAYVVADGTGDQSGKVTARGIMRHCSRNLPSHKVPFHVEFVAALPKNSTGKILRRKLREGLKEQCWKE